MTTADESALLTAIRANPDDDAPRLIYADWLDENGEPDRAELIRVQIELANMNRRHYLDCTSTTVRSMESRPLRRRELELLSNIADILKDMPEGWTINLGDGTRYSSLLETATSYEVKIVRGFVPHVTADLSTLVGGQCAQCHGFGVVRLPINHSGYMRCTSAECDYCLGTGRINGTLPKIVRSRCAAIERVTASDSDAITALSDDLIRWAWSVDPEASNVDAAR